MATKSVVEGEELSHVSAGVWPHREWQQPMVNVIIRCERERGGEGVSVKWEQVKQSSLEATFQSSEDFCSLKLFKNYFSLLKMKVIVMRRLKQIFSKIIREG